MKIMNKKIMIIWGMLIFLICTTLLLIGFKYKDTDYMRLELDLRSATKAYVKKNNLNPKISESVKVFIDELINDNYISEDMAKKYCIDSVTYSNGILVDDYKIETNCDKNEE